MSLKNTLSLRFSYETCVGPSLLFHYAVCPAPSYPLMILAYFVKSKIMNIPSALRSSTSCNFLSKSWTCFEPTETSLLDLLKSSPCFIFSHQNLYAFPHSPLFVTGPLKCILFNLMNRVIFCENYTSKNSWICSFLKRGLISLFSGSKILLRLCSVTIFTLNDKTIWSSMQSPIF